MLKAVCACICVGKCVLVKREKEESLCSKKQLLCLPGLFELMLFLSLRGQ